MKLNRQVVTSRMYSTDCEAMKILFQKLDKKTYYLFDCMSDFYDPYSGAHVYNLPCCFIGFKTKSIFRNLASIKSQIRGKILHKKLKKVEKLIKNRQECS